jgi:hypothetical protein
MKMEAHNKIFVETMMMSEVPLGTLPFCQHTPDTFPPFSVVERDTPGVDYALFVVQLIYREI